MIAAGDPYPGDPLIPGREYTVRGAPVAGVIKEGFIRIREAGDPTPDIADRFEAAFRSPGAREAWVIYTDPVFGRVAVSAELAEDIGVTAPGVADELAGDDDEIERERAELARTAEEADAGDRAYRARQPGLADDLAESAGGVLGAIGGALGTVVGWLGGVIGTGAAAAIASHPVLAVGAVVGVVVVVRRATR